MIDRTSYDLFDTIDFANAWSALGRAIQDQVELLVRYGSENAAELLGNGKINPAAIIVAQRHMRGLCEELDELLQRTVQELEHAQAGFGRTW